MIEPTAATETRLPHFGPWIRDYVADRLDSRSSRVLESHALTCDLCFAALMAMYFREAPEQQPTRTA